MSCVAFWTTCEDCKHEGYGRYHKEECEKCGSKNVVNVQEWDEEHDHN